MKKTTIQDIANACNVSIGTVDRVIHQRGRISKETEQLVIQAMEQLNYIPKHSSAEKNLKCSIGVYYPTDQAEDSFWKDAECGIDKAEEYLKPLGIQLIREKSTSFTINEQEHALKDLVQKGVGGIITTAFDSTASLSFRNIVPNSIPFATVINRSWNDQSLFHIGPNDEAMGSAIARLIALYCRPDADVVVIAPSLELEGTQKRLAGFISKIKTELTQLNILRIAPVLANSSETAYRLVEEQTAELLQAFDHVDAVYVTNGFVRSACDALKKSNKLGITQVFGHEIFSNIEGYIKGGLLTASIYQNPQQQWYEAIINMANYLLRNQVPEHNIAAECTIITKESLPLIRSFPD